MTASRPLSRSAGVLALLVVALLVASPAASWAYGGGATTNPADGAILDAAPAEVIITGPARIDADASHVAVLDAAGTAVPARAPTQTGGGGLAVPVTITASGNYTLVYHAEFADGSQSSGIVRFSVGTGVAPPAADDAGQRAAAQFAAAHEHSVDALGATMLAIDALVLFGAVALFFLRRPRTAESHGPDDQAS